MEKSGLNLNSRWANQTTPSQQSLLASGVAHCEVKQGDIRGITSQVPSLYQAILEERETAAVVLVTEGLQRLRAQDCVLQLTRPPWQRLQVVLVQHHPHLRHLLRLLLQQQRLA